MEFPRIISVDDHVLEPADVWTSRLPRRYRDIGPRVVREYGSGAGAFSAWHAGADGPRAGWADVWHYEDTVSPLYRGMAMSGHEDDDAHTVVTYEDVLPGTYERTARLSAMDTNHTDVSLCFPSIARFCGQIFLEAQDKDLALLCVQAYNDWMIEEWCGNERPARLVPMTLIPLWDPLLAAAEVRRCAGMGSHAITFSECPPHLGLPSIFSDHWDPLFEACAETDTVINQHVGSSSKVLTTASDAPTDMRLCLTYVNSMLAFSDWLYSGTFELFPSLKVALSESQAGWIPFAAERVDNTWKKGNEKFSTSVATGGRRAKELPSSNLEGRIFACIFDDLVGLQNRHQIGMQHLLFETDFPHADSTYPHSKKTAGELVVEAGLSEQETYQLLRGNAIKVYGLDAYFGITR